MKSCGRWMIHLCIADCVLLSLFQVGQIENVSCIIQQPRSGHALTTFFHNKRSQRHHLKREALLKTWQRKIYSANTIDKQQSCTSQCEIMVPNAPKNANVKHLKPKAHFHSNYFLHKKIKSQPELIQTGSITREEQNNSIAQLWTIFCILFSKCFSLLFVTEFKHLKCNFITLMQGKFISLNFSVEITYYTEVNIFQDNEFISYTYMSTFMSKFMLSEI